MRKKPCLFGNYDKVKARRPINNNNNMEGTRPPTGASPTQPYKCGQNLKINFKTALSLILTLTLKY